MDYVIKAGCQALIDGKIKKAGDVLKGLSDEKIEELTIGGIIETTKQAAERAKAEAKAKKEAARQAKQAAKLNDT